MVKKVIRWYDEKHRLAIYIVLIQNIFTVRRDDKNKFQIQLLISSAFWSDHIELCNYILHNLGSFNILSNQFDYLNQISYVIQFKTKNINLNIATSNFTDIGKYMCRTKTKFKVVISKMHRISVDILQIKFRARETA